MRALVTGHRGFIGRHMADALTGAGYDVVGWDLDIGSDARDLFRREERRFDVVVHCAAMVGGRLQIEEAPLAQGLNLELDAAMFGWAARTRAGRVIYYSSSAAYPVALQTGTPPFVLDEDDIDLDDARQPDQVYGWCKLTGEKLAVLTRRAGVPVSVIRPFSGYGEDQSLDYPFPAMAARARRRAEPFTVWGSGEQVRDFIHVDDICAATMTMISEGIDGPVNFGNSRPTPMLELAGMMCREAGYRPEIATRPEKPAGVMYRVANVARMTEFWTPKVTLEEGIRRAVSGG
jgi:UDP-glucose 4-epimerase